MVKLLGFFSIRVCVLRVMFDDRLHITDAQILQLHHKPISAYFDWSKGSRFLRSQYFPKIATSKLSVWITVHRRHTTPMDVPTSSCRNSILTGSRPQHHHAEPKGHRGPQSQWLTHTQRCAAFVEPDGATESLLISSVGRERPWKPKKEENERGDIDVYVYDMCLYWSTDRKKKQKNAGSVVQGDGEGGVTASHR